MRLPKVSPKCPIGQGVHSGGGNMYAILLTCLKFGYNNVNSIRRYYDEDLSGMKFRQAYIGS